MSEQKRIYHTMTAKEEEEIINRIKAEEEMKKKSGKGEKKINPKWKQYNDLYNESAEGYNPHEKYSK